MAHIIEITDFSAPELDIYARLTENQLVNRADPENALFVAESPLVIGRALDAGCTPVSFLMERKHIEGKGAEVLARCPADIPVYAADLPVLTQLTGFHLTRGMLCAMRRPRLPSVAEVCANARRIAVLENIMNPTNIGAIFRSAAALNVDAVLLTAAGSDPLYRRAARVSMGNVFLVPWTYLPEGESWPELLHELGFKTVALALRDDSLALNDPRLLAEPKLAMVLGTEGDVVMRPIEADVDRQMLADAVAKLNPRERDIITMRFGLGGSKELTQKEVADRLGISQSYISRLEKRIILRLRREILRMS